MSNGHGGSYYRSGLSSTTFPSRPMQRRAPTNASGPASSTTSATLNSHASSSNGGGPGSGGDSGAYSHSSTSATSLRPLPAFGSPNEFPNPPSHYFPSKPRPVRQRSPDDSDGEASERRKPRGAAATSNIGEHAASARAANPHFNTAAGVRNSFASDQWDVASSSTRDDLDDSRAMDTDGDDDGESVGGTPGDRDDDGMDDGASISSANQKRAAPASAGKEKEGAKKRSRTLTTAHQTAVLNALLAKTRFPSTETREEVGQQIGMSARRVQIWFQNRRQSQKRVRDREASELGAASTSKLPHHEYQRNDPYARYPGPPMSSASSGSTARPTLSRQVSGDSIGSYTSAHASVNSFQRGRDTLSPLSDVPPRWPGTAAAPSTAGYGGWMATPHDRRDVSGGYFAGAVPGRQQAAPMPERSATSSKTPGTNDGHVRLPSLSAVLGTTPADSPSERSPFANSHPFSNRGPPPAPSSGTRAFTNERNMLTAGATGRSFDDFSRLRISNDTPAVPERHSSPPDILDAAMETMFRSAALPARSTLPPLRSTTFGSPPTAAELELRKRPSEADAALLAPILPVDKGQHQLLPRLPPLSSLALTTPNVFPLRPSAAASHQSMGSSRAARSSISSFDTLGTWSAASGANGQSQTNASIASCNTSRTSFSSEVQEEWDRMTSGVGRKVKTAEVGWDGAPQPNSRRVPSLHQQREIRMGSP